MVTSIPGAGGTILDLKKISAKFFDQAKLSAIVKQVAESVVSQAQGNVPVDTGTLQRAIGYQLQGLIAQIFANTDYAAPVEFGHVTRGGTFVAAHPYMEPAMQDGMALLKTLVQRHMEMSFKS